MADAGTRYIIAAVLLLLFVVAVTLPARVQSRGAAWEAVFLLAAALVLPSFGLLSSDPLPGLTVVSHCLLACGLLTLAAALLPRAESRIDACASYPAAEGRRDRHYFTDRTQLVETLLGWKRQGHQDIWLTWGNTRPGFVREIEEQIRVAGVEYRVPGG
jgi:hypothetical protein